MATFSLLSLPTQVIELLTANEVERKWLYRLHSLYIQQKRKIMANKRNGSFGGEKGARKKYIKTKPKHNKERKLNKTREFP